MLQLSFTDMQKKLIFVVVVLVALFALIIAQDSCNPFMCLRTLNKLLSVIVFPAENMQFKAQWPQGMHILSFIF